MKVLHETVKLVCDLMYNWFSYGLFEVWMERPMAAVNGSFSDVIPIIQAKISLFRLQDTNYMRTLSVVIDLNVASLSHILYRMRLFARFQC